VGGIEEGTMNRAPTNEEALFGGAQREKVLGAFDGVLKAA